MSGLGKMIGIPSVSDVNKFIAHIYGEGIVTSIMCITGAAPRLLTAIQCVPITAGTDVGAVTLAFFYANTTSGTSSTLANGTSVSTGTVNLKGTVNVLQSLTLTNTAGVLIPPYSAIGFVLTGTATAAVGTLQIVLDPAS